MLYGYFQRMLSCRKSGSAVIGVIIDPVDIHIALQQKFYQLKLFGVACCLQQIESFAVNGIAIRTLIKQCFDLLHIALFHRLLELGLQI